MLTRTKLKQPLTLTLTDLETTGLDEQVHIPIQLAAIKLIHAEDPCDLTVDCTMEFKLKLPPGVKVAPEAAAMNGYKESVWKEHAEDRVDAYRQYLKELEWSSFGGQNPCFDYRHLSADFRRHALEWPRLSYYGLTSVDTMARPLRLLGYTQNLKQATLCSFFKLGGQTHDALNDILQAAELYRRLLWLEIKGFTEENIQTAVDMPSELYNKK